jgi:hypothetical protein
MPKRCHKYCAAHDYCDFYVNEVKPLISEKWEHLILILTQI